MTTPCPTPVHTSEDKTAADADPKAQKETTNSDARQPTSGEFQDQADARGIGTRGPLRAHNDTPCGRGGPPPAGGRAAGGGGPARRACFVVLVYINQ
jgi:hypothetical protein